MDTVNFVLTLLGTFMLTTIGALALAYREHHRAEVAQRELARLLRQRAPYDTGLVEIVQVPESV